MAISNSIVEDCSAVRSNVGVNFRFNWCGETMKDFDIAKLTTFWLPLLTIVLVGHTLLGQQDIRRYSIEQFLKTTSYRGASFSNDESKILVSNDSTGVFNAYSVDVQTGETKQLTKSDKDSIFSIGFFPEDDRFLYTADQGGNELNHVYVQMEDGTSKDLTPGEKLKANFIGWADDDQSFYVATNERDQRYFDIYGYQVADFSRELIFQNDGGFLPGAISRDGTQIALGKVETRDNSDIYIYNRSDQTIKCVTEHDGAINHSARDFTPDGSALIYTTDRDDEFNYLVEMDLESGQTKEIAKRNWDVSGAGFSKSGKFLTIGFNEDGKTELLMYQYPAMSQVELPVIKGASLGSVSFADDDSCIAMYASSGRMPGDLFYYEFSDAPNSSPVR